MKKTIILFYFLLGTGIILSAQTLDDARKLTENEQYESATEAYKSLISREPSNGLNYYYFGENLLLSENPDSASLIFKKGREQDPTNQLLKIGEAKVLLNSVSLAEAKAASNREPSNMELKTRADLAQSNLNAATTLLNEAELAAPQKSATVLIEIADALIHFKNKNLDKAKSVLDKAFAIEPKNSDIQILFGDIYAEQNNGTLSADYYNKALDLNKTSARAVVSKGRLYKRSTNYEGAAAEFQSAITLSPDYAPAYRELGETNFKLGKLEKAKENYRKYLELSKNNCGARIRYASFLYLSKDYSGAINELTQTQQKCDPKNLTMLRVFSYCYYETKEYSKGLESVNTLFTILPDDKRTAVDYEYYGKLLIASNQDSLGILQLRQAYSIDLNRTDLLSEISNSYYKLKKYSEAAAVLEEKILTAKDLKVADYFMLGRSYYFNTQFGLADSAFAKVNELSPKYASGWLWRAKANTQIDSTSEAGLAKPHFEKYIELALADSANLSKYQSGMVEAYGYLAYYFILKKDNENALLNLKKKIELPLEPEEKKSIQKAIDQLEGKPVNK